MGWHRHRLGRLDSCQTFKRKKSKCSIPRRGLEFSKVYTANHFTIMTLPINSVAPTHKDQIITRSHREKPTSSIRPSRLWASRGLRRGHRREMRETPRRWIRRCSIQLPGPSMPKIQGDQPRYHLRTLKKLRLTSFKNKKPITGPKISRKSSQVSNITPKSSASWVQGLMRHQFRENEARLEAEVEAPRVQRLRASSA